MEGFNQQIEKHNAKEKEPLDIGRKFRIKFQEQLEEDLVVPTRLDDGRVVDVPSFRIREDATEFVEELKLFWEKAEQSYKEYWQKPIAKTGAQYHDTKKFPLHQIDEVKGDLEKGGTGRTYDALSEIKQETLLAFELYSCIEAVKPDRIIALVNGAARLDSLAYALGADSMNYLSIHRSIDKDHRKELSAGPIYEGKPILPGSTVLLLEDTSDLADERTYRDAREWLKEQGVTNAPVFLEYMTRLDQFAMQHQGWTVEQQIEIQQQLNDENCWNAYANTTPGRHSEFWKAIKGRLTTAIESNPQLIDSFFELIRKYKK